MRFLVLILACLASASCATVFSGSDQMLTVNSSPPGARIYVNDEYKGITPNSFRIKRKLASYQITLKSPGFEDFHGNLEHRLNRVAILNLGNAFGWVIDVASGAVMKYDEAVHYELVGASPQLSYR